MAYHITYFDEIFKNKTSKHNKIHIYLTIEER